MSSYVKERTAAAKDTWPIAAFLPSDDAGWVKSGAVIDVSGGWN